MNNGMTPKMKLVMATNNFGRGIPDKERLHKAMVEGKVDNYLFDKLANGDEILYTPEQVVEKTGLKKTLIYRWCRTGVLAKSFKVGKLWFIPRSDLREIMERDESRMTAE